MSWTVGNVNAENWLGKHMLTISAICCEIDATRLGISDGLDDMGAKATICACSCKSAVTASGSSPWSRCHAASAALCCATDCVAMKMSAADTFE